MKAVLFYTVYPLIYLIAHMPFSWLYRLSDGLYYVLRLTGYRENVVLQNLRNSFPEKDEEEIREISEKYFRYLCDLVLETLKTLNMPEESTRKHCTFHNTDWLDRFREQKQSFIIVMGHYGNWEWAGPAFTLATKFQLVVIYRPLSNRYFDQMMTRTRTRFGTRITPVTQTLRDMVANRNQLTATAFVADQYAPGSTSHWTTFLNQDTSVFTGPEKLAVRFNYPVVYINVVRTFRGRYDVYPELLVANPSETSTNEIAEAFIRRLEREIIRDPVPWLWSHRRWKYKRT